MKGASSQHSPSLIYRYDRPSFHGWEVRLTRAGETFSRFFSDGGSRQVSLRRALRWREQMLATLPPPLRIKRVFSRNTTGVIGVHVREERNRRGQVIRRYYGATWRDLRGQPQKRLFSVDKLGERRARELAIQARQRALAELLRPHSAAGLSHRPRRDGLSRLLPCAHSKEQAQRPSQPSAHR